MEKEHVKLNPAGFYRTPKEVLDDKSLSESDKIDVLERWAYDVNELSVAEEENMPGSGRHNYAVLLQEIHNALVKLGVGHDESRGGVTKHGS